MTNEMPSRDVILTTLQRVPLDYAATFLASLRRTGYRGELVFFVSAMEEASIAELRRQGVRVVRFTFKGIHVKQRLARLWPVWRRVFGSRLPPELKERLAHAVFHLFYRRHLLYLQYLRAHREEYDRVFLTDARDVFFQADPFSWNPSPGVHFFLEEAEIGSCPFNARWITSQFGPATAEAMKTKTISCAGTVFGDTDGILRYLAAMVALTMSARSLREPTGDQGIHNYVLYQQPLPQMTVHDNRTGPLLTMGQTKPEAVRFNDQGWVVNGQGVMVPILHQYDRLPAVEKILLARLA
jgi:hypothetical protein